MSITVDTIFEHLHELAEQLDLDLEQVPSHGTASLEEDLGMDSLSLMDFLVFLEKRYGVSIPDEELADVATVGDVAHVLNELLPDGAVPVGARS